MTRERTNEELFCCRAEEFLHPDVEEGLIVDREEAEYGLLQRPLRSIVIHDEFVMLQEFR